MQQSSATSNQVVCPRGATAYTWKEGDTLPTLKYEPATPFYILPPGDRGYGGGKIITADISPEKIVPYAQQG